MENANVEYFLSHPNPSIRYLFLTGYENLASTDPRVKKVMEEVRSSPLVASLLGTLTENGEIPFHAYSKWRGSFWTLLQLVDLGYPPGDSMLVPLMEQFVGWVDKPTKKIATNPQSHSNRWTLPFSPPIQSDSYIPSFTYLKKLEYGQSAAFVTYPCFIGL